MSPEAPENLASLASLLAWREEHGPRGARLSFFEGRDTQRHLTYAELGERARAVAAGFARRGLLPGQRVGILSPWGLGFVEAFFGCSVAGLVPVPIAPASRPDLHARKLCSMETVANLAAYVGDPSELRLAATDRPKLSLDDLRRDASSFAPVPPSHLALIQFTSGSTGEPRAVLLSQAAVLANLDAMTRWIELGPDDCIVSWLPMFHDMGLVGTLLAGLTSGARLVLLTPMHFLADPVSFLRNVTSEGATMLLMPPFAYGMLARRSSDEAVDLSRVRAALIGSEMVSENVVEHFAHAFASRGLEASAMMPGYGLAEATLAVSLSPPGRGARVDRSTGLPLVSAGAPIPPIRVRVCGPTGEELGDREVGELEVDTPSRMDGYEGDDVANRTAFDGPWLKTGDFAYLADGEIYICGRKKDLIKRAGRAYHAGPIEAEIERVDGVAPGSVAVFGIMTADETEAPVAVIETDSRDGSSRRALVDAVRERCRTEADVLLYDVILVPPRTLPRTTSGKLQRSLCREHYPSLTGRRAS